MFQGSFVLPTVNRLVTNRGVVASLRSAGFVVVTGVLTLFLSSTCMAQHHGHHGHHGGGISVGGYSGGHHHHSGGFYGGSFYGGGLYGSSIGYGCGLYGSSFGYGSGLYGSSLGYRGGLYGSSFGYASGLYGSSFGYGGYNTYPGYYSNPRVRSYGVYSAPIVIAPRYYSASPFNSYGVVVPQQSVAMPVYPAPAAVAPSTGAQTGGPYQGELRPGMVLPDGAVVISVDPLRDPVSTPLPPAPGN